MVHAIVELQASLVTAWLADGPLTTLLGGDFVFDAPPKGQSAPYVVIVRHDALSRDGDETPGHDHRLLVHCWHGDASRKSALALADRVIAVALSADLNSAGLIVTHIQHDRTDSAIDLKTGRARAALALRAFTEPAA